MRSGMVREEWSDVAGIVRALREGAGGSSAGAPLDVGSWLSGDATPDRVRNLASDPALRRQVAAQARLAVPAPQPATHPMVWRRVAWLAMAAGIAGLVIIAPRPAAILAHRGDRVGVAVNVQPIAPVVATAPTIAWSALLGADGYELEITDAAGRVAWSVLTADTAVTVPDSAVTAGTHYFVRVRARIDAQRWRSSAYQEFTVRK